MAKESKYMNPDGTFKKLEGSAFKMCVMHQMEVKGLKQENAQKLCAYIGRKAGKIK